VVGQHRSSQRHVGKVVDLEEAKLRHRLREIAAEHIRWGRRMAHRLLRREGWTVNHKRVHRLCLAIRVGRRCGVVPRNRSRVNESSHPARLGRGLHHETNPSHTRADHPQAQNG
jgi:hypothetical protein